MIAKGFKGKYFSLAAIVATVSMANLQATASTVMQKEHELAKEKSKEKTAKDESSTIELDNIVVEAEGIKSYELRAGSNYEVYTSKDIENSKSIDLIDFLNRYTSVNISSTYGNIFTPKIDIHGFGLSSGFENVVILIDGKRINNIDLLPPLLSSIPLESVEKIEILKGSGSVIYGDGSTAGVINIKTKPSEGFNYKIFKGNYKTLGTTFSGGISGEGAFGYFYIDSYRSKGFREITADIPESREKKISSLFDITFFPNDDIDFTIQATNSKIKNYYANSLTKDQFEDDPKQEGNPNWAGYTYNYQIIKDRTVSFDLNYKINSNFKINLSHSKTDRFSEYVLSNYISRYDYKQYDLKLNYENGGFDWIFGVSKFDGDRENISNTTSKNSYDYYMNLSNIFEKHKLSLGYRRGKVEYKYDPNNGNDLSDSNSNHSITLGYNYQISNNSSFYANFTRAYQFPDIDRFFSYDFFTNSFVFNNFIDTMITKTYTIGFNKITKDQKLKISAFYIDVKNEIYYNPATYTNTNLDKTEKKGIDLEYRKKINGYLTGNLFYTYLIAKTKEDDIKDYEDKNLPGVAKHNITLSLNFKYNRFYTNISHIYRSSMYALDDFKNSFKQKQKPYNSTDISLGYELKKNFEIFAKMDNIFNYKNGVWIKDDVIYPENCVRRYYIGIKGNF
ncbi:TonB-dependent receptor plug domain-containing protein [Nitrosophilus kaiyonis]|uniref:TonB-dependent receptor plug domain-containing protein n=1 Tax=Nitrosophilus kaiyonis TaxID=2930200 RepID=UPI0024903EB2|nr:TonB-dependent receptor [Nitrosophilus kaiyonis]